jgi:hypothetical protein
LSSTSPNPLTLTLISETSQEDILVHEVAKADRDAKEANCAATLKSPQPATPTAAASTTPTAEAAMDGETVSLRL